MASGLRSGTSERAVTLWERRLGITGRWSGPLSPSRSVTTRLRGYFEPTLRALEVDMARAMQPTSMLREQLRRPHTVSYVTLSRTERGLTR